MDKDHVIREIRRTAAANGGVPLGWRRFEGETGIRYHDWYGQFWIRWSDAIREAGFEPNQMTEAYDDEYLLEKLVKLTRDLGHVPVVGEMILASKRDATFPSEKVYRRLGSKARRVSRVIDYCQRNPGQDDVIALWSQVSVAEPSTGNEREVADSAPVVGYIYLLKHGTRREYKIGRTNNPIRREGEMGIQLPEKLEPLHYIQTDDPVGIEAYWHTRFASKRKNGEWFALTPQDVRAFKRWKRIY